ncbi:MAG: hypothetical protein Q4D71_10240 [Oscillospiraceae bacterium]|nr:hypothetical protein [Oscillospiraceae bacterium]
MDEEDYLTYSNMVNEDLAELKASQKTAKNVTGKNSFHQTTTAGSNQDNIRNSTNSHDIPSRTRSTKGSETSTSSNRKSTVFGESSRPNLYDSNKPEGTPAWFREFAGADYYRRIQEDHAHYRKRFLDQYAPDKLSKLSRDDLLRKVFGTSGSMLYDLTQNKEDYWRFGSCGQYKYLWIVYHTDGGSWMYKRGSRSRAVSREEASMRAVEVRDLLLRSVDIIKNTQLPDIISDYRFLEGALSHIFFYSYPWVLKYYQMLFPERFPCMYADNTLERALQILGLPSHGSRYLNLGEIALFTGKCGIDNSVFTTIYGDRWGWVESRSPCAGAKKNWEESKIAVKKYRNQYM